MKSAWCTLFVSIALVGCLTGAACVVEPKNPPRTSTAPTEFPFKIPFELVENHLILPIHIGHDEKPFRLVLDTGMPVRGVVLYKSARVDALKLDFERGRVNIGGAGGDGEASTARVAQSVHLQLGELELPPSQALIMPKTSHKFDFHDGIIGAELFRRYTVRIDYSRQTLVLHEPSQFKAPAAAVALPMKFGGGVPFINLTVTATDGSRSSADVVVDLGAGHPISLNALGPGPLAAPPGSPWTVLGTGLSGDITGRIGRIATLDLGGLSLESVVTSFPDFEHQHPRGMNSHQGNLGSAVLRRFDVTFDYKRKTMWLEATERMRQPFEYDMSGLRLGRNEKRELVVKKVFRDSPASDAGLRPGDVLTRFAGKNTIDVQLFEVRAKFRQIGDEIPLTVRRRDEVRQVTLKLRRLI